MEQPKLKIIPLDNLVPHEHFDPQRTLPLYRRMRTSQLFRHPPIVMPLRDSRHLILDGANRAAVLREMGMDHILAQEVEPDDPGLKILSWNHVLSDLDPDDLLRSLEEIPGLELKSIHPDAVEEAPRTGQGLAAVLVREAGAYRLKTQADSLRERVRLLNAIVNSYQNFASMDRTTVVSLNPLLNLYPTLTGLVVFPPFRIDELREMVEHGDLLPPGVTRTTISPRALHVNFPLEELARPTSLKEKNAALETFLQQRMAAKKVRHYAEATFFFDE